MVTKKCEPAIGTNQRGRGDSDNDSVSEGRRPKKRCFTIEPVNFLYLFGVQIVEGASVNVDLIVWKVCNVELAYNQTVCDNLTDDRFTDLEANVQWRVNHVRKLQSIASYIPVIFYVFLAGALSDKWGRKPCLLFPLIGTFISGVLSMINCLFIRQLPMEFFLLEEFASLFGGRPVYFLGIYGFGSTVSDPQDRAHFLTRLDGIERIGAILGVALSPYVFQQLGYLGPFALRTGANLLAIGILVFIVEEPLKRDKPPPPAVEETEESRGPSLSRFFRSYFLNPFKETCGTLLRRRSHNMRALIIIQLAIYACYLACLRHERLLYLYMMRAFGADGTDYALLISVRNVLSAFGLIVMIPIFTKVLKFHETTVLLIINSSVVVSWLLSALSTSLWPAFFIFQWVAFLSWCQYGVSRALLTKSVEDNEIGKILSGNALVAAVVPMVSDQVYRFLYDLTLQTQPNVFIFVAVAVMCLAIAMLTFLSTKRGVFASYRRHLDAKGQMELADDAEKKELAL